MLNAEEFSKDYFNIEVIRANKGKDAIIRTGYEAFINKGFYRVRYIENRLPEIEGVLALDYIKVTYDMENSYVFIEYYIPCTDNERIIPDSYILDFRVRMDLKEFSPHLKLDFFQNGQMYDVDIKTRGKIYDMEKWDECDEEIERIREKVLASKENG